MKRLPALLTVAVIVVAALGWYAWRYFNSNEELSPWDVVPDNVVLVYEFSACPACTESLSNSSIGTLIRSSALPLAPSDSLNKVGRFLYQYHEGGLVSMQVTKTNDFDFVFYLPTDKKLNQAGFDVALESWRGDKSLKFTDREFNGIKIYEVSSNKSIFSWAEIEKVWVGSFTPFLVEDAIRSYGDQKKRFKGTVKDLSGLAKVKNDAGNLYVNIGKLIEALSVFTSGNAVTNIGLGRNALLDVKKGDDGLIMNGFTIINSSAKGNLMSALSDQDPVSFDLKSLISNRTVFLANYGFSDGNTFFKQLHESFQIPNDSTSQALRTYGVDLTSLYGTAGKNLLQAFVESRGQQFSRIGLVQTSDPAPWKVLFGKVAASSETADTLFFERYYDYEIREVELSQFPDHLFYPLLRGYHQTYYTFHDKVLLFADDLEELKRFLDDIENEETWGRSVTMNHFLESTLLESNLSFYFNTPRVWNLLINHLSEPWRSFTIQNRNLLDDLGPGAIQFSNLNEQFYTNLFWQLQPNHRTENTSKTNVKIETSLKGDLFTVRNHVDKSLEMLVQDSLNNLYLASSTGKILWKKPLDGKIRGDVDQIDYFKNGKLQYFFATRNKLWIVDRLGNEVSPFPLTVPVKDDIDYATVVDYDKSRNYRFLVAEDEGRLWLYDKVGQPLEGWSPHDVGGPLFAPARHHRIGAKDHVLAIRRDGWVHLMNRRGDGLKGFPLNLDARPSGDYAFIAGKDGTASKVVLVSRDGFKIMFNFAGALLNREPLVKESIDARFSLVASSQLDSYIIVRQEAKKMVIYNENGQPFINSNFIGLNPVKIAYYDLSAGRTFVTVTDQQQDLIYVYDGQGNLLTTIPLEGSSSVIVPESVTEARAVVLYNKTLTWIPLK